MGENSRRPAERATLRFAAAAAALVAAAAHVPVTEPHLREAPYVGALFVALEVSLTLLAVALLLVDTRLVWHLAGSVSSMAIVGYVLSRTVGLPQIRDDVGNWTEPLGVVALTFEGLLLVAVLVRHAASWSLTTADQVVLTTVVLLLGVAATGRAAATVPATHAMGAGGAGYWGAVAGRGPASTGVTRTYYISADPVVWNYAPTGRNLITGRAFTADERVFAVRGQGRIGPRYVKCLYRAYTGAGFRHLEPRSAGEAYLGVLGPVLHAEVGDTIKVHFRNTCPFPTSVHPHGVFYGKASEGAPYQDGTRAKADDAVPPGHRHTYTWRVPERAGPGPHDGSSVMWMYHSHTDEVADTYAGLVGPMVVTRAGQARADGSPADVDREVFESFFIDNETLSPLLRRNLDRFGSRPLPEDLDGEDFVESNLKHSVNGYLYGNGPVVTLNRGEHVRWYVMSMGTEVDLHTPHWHGNTVTVGGMRMDVVSLLPASMVIADMVPDDPGTWLLHCHVNDHIAAGMQTRYRVR